MCCLLRRWCLNGGLRFRMEGSYLRGLMVLVLISQTRDGEFCICVFAFII